MGPFALPRAAFQTHHKATTQTFVSSEMSYPHQHMSYPYQHMSYPHQLGHIQHSSMVAGVRLQSIHGTYPNEPKTQEVIQDPAWGYNMASHAMVSLR